MSPNRIEGPQERMAEAGIEAAIILYSRDLLYYTGTTQPCILLVTPREFHLFVRWGYDFAIADTWLNKGRLSSQSRLEAVVDKLKQWQITKGSLGLELDVMPAESYLRWQKLFPDFQIVNMSPLILEQRKKKDASEISLIRKACQIVDTGHDEPLRFSRKV